jgi:hypothetical protein
MACKKQLVAADNGNLFEVMFLQYVGIARKVSGLPACSGPWRRMEGVETCGILNLLTRRRLEGNRRIGPTSLWKDKNLPRGNRTPGTQSSGP